MGTFDPTSIKDTTIRAAYTAAATPVDRVAVSSCAQDCAIALAQLGRGYSGQGITIRGGALTVFGAKTDPATLAAVINGAAFDDGELAALQNGLKAALGVA